MTPPQSHGVTVGPDEIETGHNILAKLFELPVYGQGSGQRYVSLKNSHITVEERDVIVKAVREWISK